MKEVTIVHNDPQIEEELKYMNLQESILVNFIDFGSNKEKSQAYKVMGKWGATKVPFITVSEEGKVIKAFYSEAEDVLIELKNYINDRNA